MSTRPTSPTSRPTSRARHLTLAASGVLCAAALTVGAAGSSTAGATPVASAGRPTTTADPATPTPRNPTRNPATLDEIKQQGANAIAERQAQLTKLAGRLGGAPTCDTSGTVAATIAADQSGLATLGTKLAADTTVPTARDDFNSIFQDFRVYLVVTPQAYATSACGHIQTAVTGLQKDAAALAAKVQAAANGGADTTAAQAALTDMNAQLADATAKANHASASLTAIGPDHGDKAVAASNKAAVDAAHDELEAAHTSLTAAVKDAHAVIDALKAIAGH